MKKMQKLIEGEKNIGLVAELMAVQKRYSKQAEKLAARHKREYEELVREGTEAVNYVVSQLSHSLGMGGELVGDRYGVEVQFFEQHRIAFVVERESKQDASSAIKDLVASLTEK